MAAAEQKKSYHVSKNFKGLNTKANRTAIDPDEFSWLVNAMPVGYANLKIVGNKTSVVNSTNVAVTWTNPTTYFTTCNINLNPYILSFQDDGSAEYFNNQTLVKGTLAPAGTFSTSGVRATQWKNERILITDPVKGFFTWDAVDLITLGGVGLITVTNGGSNYTTPPEVIISAPNDANGIQATATASLSTGYGSIKTIEVTTIGTGYTSIPTVSIGAPDQLGGTQAYASAAIQGGGVVAITVTAAGSGYTVAPSVSITGGGGASAAATAKLAYGSVLYVTLDTAGSGYTSPPTVTFQGGGGSGANAVASLTSFATGGVTVTLENGGDSYTSPPTVTISGGGGANANAICLIQGNSVSSVVMVNPGDGYTNAANITVTFTGGGGANATATATIDDEPNVDVQTFSGRAWLAKGRTVYYTSPDDYSDFNSVSAGNVILTDATLTTNIIKLLSANNFLYIFGEDSINVFSDVRVTATGVTLFTNTNVSASIGTDLPLAIFPYFRSVLFMNKYGVYALVGSTTSKLSDQLDGIFPDIDFTYPAYAGQVLINNILCAAFNFWYNDPDSLTTYPLQAVYFDKRWFLTNQGSSIQHMASLAYNGRIELYAADGDDLIKFYTNYSSDINSIIETALLSMDDPIRTKQALKIGLEATTIDEAAVFDVTVDNENRQSAAYTLSSVVNWTNNSLQVVPWVNNSLQPVNWVPVGYFLYKTDAQQYGKYLGMTVTSQSPNFVINGFQYEHEMRVRF